MAGKSMEVIRIDLICEENECTMKVVGIFATFRTVLKNNVTFTIFF